MTCDDDGLRAELRALLEGGNAHVAFEDAVRGMKADLRGRRPAGLPRSAWELLEHMRIAQRDILRFIDDAKYESPPWPDGYWPELPDPPKAAAWDHSVDAYLADRQSLVRMLADSSRDLMAKIPHGSGQNVLREMLLVADHGAYHLGQLVLVRRLLGEWSNA